MVYWTSDQLVTTDWRFAEQRGGNQILGRNTPGMQTPCASRLIMALNPSPIIHPRGTVAAYHTHIDAMRHRSPNRGLILRDALRHAKWFDPQRGHPVRR